MAKKILKGAYTKFHVDCEKCGCEYEYELSDLEQCSNGVKEYWGTSCPDCRYPTPHGCAEGLPSSRKKVINGPETMEEGWCADCQRHTKLFLLELRWLCKSCYEYHTGKDMNNV